MEITFSKGRAKISHPNAVEKNKRKMMRAHKQVVCLQLANRIVTLRKTRRMSQMEFSRKTGLPQMTIFRLEAGRHNPQLDTIITVADALGISLLELLQGIGPQNTLPLPKLVVEDVEKHINHDGTYGRRKKKSKQKREPEDDQHL